MPNLKLLLGGLAVVIVLAVGIGAYSVLRTPAAPSASLAAIPLDSTGGASSASAAASVSAAASASASAAPSASAAAASAETEASGTASVAADASVAASAVVASIVADESEARFVIDEVLNNAPKTVIGTTKQIAGELAVDPGDPTKSRVGTIQVNARDLTTDSDFRNRAIKNQILQTDQYELITFEPTELTGLPTSGAVGQTYTFQMNGNLTIKDVTKPVTFDVTVTPESETRLTGTATATIKYADWGITIPQVRQVASVSDDVRLELDFVAVPN